MDAELHAGVAADAGGLGLLAQLVVLHSRERGQPVASRDSPALGLVQFCCTIILLVRHWLMVNRFVKSGDYEIKT